MKIIKNKIVIASHNEGKISEIKEIFNDFKYQVYSSKEFKLEEPEETGSSFEENALIKAKFTSKKTGFVSLSDDSGLCIDALNGEPGVYSARYAGKDKDFNLLDDTHPFYNCYDKKKNPYSQFKQYTQDDLEKGKKRKKFMDTPYKMFF